MHFLPIIPMSTTKNLKIIHKQTQEDSGKWRGEGRLAWDLGIQGTTQQWVPGFSFCLIFPTLGAEKIQSLEKPLGADNKSQTKREENLGPTLLRKGMEDPLSIHPCGRVNRVPFLVFFLLDYLALKKGGRAYFNLQTCENKCLCLSLVMWNDHRQIWLRKREFMENSFHPFIRIPSNLSLGYEHQRVALLSLATLPSRPYICYAFGIVLSFLKGLSEVQLFWLP